MARTDDVRPTRARRGSGLRLAIDELFRVDSGLPIRRRASNGRRLTEVRIRRPKPTADSKTPRAA